VLLRRKRLGPYGYARGLGLSWNRSYPTLIGYALLAPLAVWIALILVYPVFNTVYLSLTNTRIIGAPSGFIGLTNYQTVIASPEFWRGLLLSLAWLVGNGIVQTIAAFATALLLRQSWRFARQARIWVLLPWVIPTVAVAVIWQWMLNSNYGIISHGLQASGVISSPLNVFGSPAGALLGLIVTNSWHWFALPAVVIFGAMQTIPSALYDAAKVDGAGPIAQFRYITLPMIARTLFVLELVGNLWTFNVLDIIFLITRGGPADASLTMPVELYYTAFKAWRIGEAAAMTIVVLGLLAAVSFLYVRRFAPRGTGA
jgi:multiple sugar transport system permease protein